MIPFLDTLINFGTNVVGKILDRTIPDTNARHAAQEEADKEIRQLAEEAANHLQELAMAELKAVNDENQAQNDLNKIDAASSDRFQRHWRPWLGYFGGTSFVASCMFIVVASIVWHLEIPVNAMIALGSLATLVFGMIGIRTVEKSKGIADASSCASAAAQQLIAGAAGKLPRA